MSNRVRPRPKLDVDRIVADLGGVASAHLRFRTLGIKPPTENAIRLWVYRGRIPGDWTGALWLVLLGEHAGRYVVHPGWTGENGKAEVAVEEEEEEVDPFEEGDDPFEGLELSA